MPQERVIKACQKRNDREVIEKRKIAADDEKNLKSDEQNAGDVADPSWPEGKPRHDEFDEMIPCRLKFMEPQRRKVKITADRAGYRLRFVMIGKASEIAPARVATQFDQTGADHDPKSKPAKQPENQDRRPALRKWPPVE